MRATRGTRLFSRYDERPQWVNGVEKVAAVECRLAR